jgi:hypothetical protein
LPDPRFGPPDELVDVPPGEVLLPRQFVERPAIGVQRPRAEEPLVALVAGRLDKGGSRLRQGECPRCVLPEEAVSRVPQDLGPVTAALLEQGLQERLGRPGLLMPQKYRQLSAALGRSWRANNRSSTHSPTIAMGRAPNGDAALPG